jgi:UDP-N-acetylmuramoylalanine--D-glutamate ligase
MKQQSKIAILGYGVEGQATLKYLHAHGYENLTVCDRNVDLDVEFPDGVSARLGPDYLKDLTDFEVLFRSPGIKWLKSEIQNAVARGLEVTSATKFFLDQSPCPVIGVTGTKGKGTTCSLLFEMLKRGGREAEKDLWLGGNIGKCPLDFLDELKGDHLVILELSSFQLQDADVSPDYAVLLNTTSDHLDYHADRGEYLAAKENLLAHQKEKDIVVLNKDYEYEKYYKPLAKGKLREVSIGHKVKNGAFEMNGVVYVARNGEADRVLGVEEIRLVGAHNLENVLPAVAVARELGVKIEDIAETVREFENLPYRLQFIRELKGVSFYNDSFSTTPDTSMAAVDSFEGDTVLIAGGYDKGADYSDWALKILTRQSLRVVILIGAAAGRMEEALVGAEEKLGEAEGSPTKILRRNRMEDAVVDGYAEVDDGGVVVMSPAAASFDMYKNYKERGNDFIAHVRKLK